MKLQYLGHSYFRIISEIGTTVVCDPFDDGTLSPPMTRVRADVVTVSHDHHDHNAVQNVLGQPAVIQVPVQCAADDVAISSVQTFHDAENGKKRGENIVFKFVTDGISVAHLGDVGFVDENVVKYLKGCDVLLIPVGGIYTVNAVEAKRFVDEIQPKIVVPMHYLTPEHTFELEELSRFTALFDSARIKTIGDTLDLWDEPQNEQTEVVVMSRFVD